MESILKRMRLAARLLLPAVVFCALGAPKVLAASADSAPASDQAGDSERPGAAEVPPSVATPDESQLSESMPEPVASTDVFKEGGRDSFSRRIPAEMTEFAPSVARLRAPQGWKEDGEVTKAHSSKIMPGPDDLAYGRMRSGAGAQVGDRLYVLRRDVAVEADKDPDAVYLQRIGVVSVEEVMSRRRVLLRVIKATGELSPSDLLSKVPL
jgi:hypothetical protein